MEPTRHERVRQIFLRCCELDLDARHRLLETECADDLSLCMEVENLLAADSSAPTVLDGDVLALGLRGADFDLGDDEADLPRVIGNYRILRRVGEGGMGIVYEAEQESPKRRVALKVISTRLASPDLRKRFENETQILGLLDHPGIAQIFEALVTGVDEGEQPYFAMEFVEGRTLTAYADDKKLDTAARLELVARICDAIQHAHEKGIVHRDLKPANILIKEDGQPKILDFGIARVTDPEVQLNTLRTGTGQLVGTLPYMSPEQVAGGTDLDSRSDVYSLGVILFELVGGQRPFDLENKSLYEALRIVRDREPPRLGTVRRALRGDVETIVGKALEKDLDRRYGTAHELATDIRRHLRREPITAHAPSRLYQFKKFASRNRLLVTGVATLGFVLTVATALSTFLAIEARTEARKANTVVEFFREMVRSADPDHARGRDYTVRQMLDDFDAGLGDQLNSEPEVEAILRSTIGAAYKELGDFDRALRQHRRALELRLAGPGERSKTTLGTMNDIANVLKLLRRYEEAEVLFLRVLRVRRELIGGDDVTTMMTLNNIAALYLDAKRTDEAEKLVLQALEIARSQSITHEETLLVLESNLSGAYFLQGRMDESERVRVRVIERRRRLHPPNQPALFADLTDLGFLYLQNRRYDEAVSCFREALAGQRRLLDPGHPFELLALQGLGDSLYRLGRHAEAAPLLREWVDTPGRHQSDPAVDRSRFWLGRCLMETGELTEAAEVLNLSLAKAVRDDGLEGGRTSAVRRTLQEVYRRQQRPELVDALEPAAPKTPAAPQSERTRDGPRGSTIVRSSPFSRVVPAMQHALSHWQIRTVDSTDRSSLRFETFSFSALTELALPPGLLTRADERTFCRVRHIGSNHAASEFSSEIELTTRSVSLDLHHFDLNAHFNRDVIANAGDADNDFFDLEGGGMLIAEGFDGSGTSTSTQSQGLTETVGVHVLGDASGRNSLSLGREDDAATIVAPQIRLGALRFLLAGGEGGGRISVALSYEGGRTETRRLPFPDWFADPRPPIGDDDPFVAGGFVATAILNNMDRWYRGKFDDANDAALFEVIVPLDPDAVLDTVVIDPRASTFEREATRFNLLALTGVLPAPASRVERPPEFSEESR